MNKDRQVVKVKRWHAFPGEVRQIDFFDDVAVAAVNKISRCFARVVIKLNFTSPPPQKMCKKALSSFIIHERSGKGWGL